MKKIILYLWQLPQHILALTLLLSNNKKVLAHTRYKSSSVYWLADINWAISLGKYIIVSDTYHNQTVVKHEYGHSIQSKMFGPLYLLIVGIPSITMNIMSTILYKLGKPKYAENYYNRWPENWADKLEEVIRE